MRLQSWRRRSQPIWLNVRLPKEGIVPLPPRICTTLPAKRHHIPPQPIRTVLKLSVPKSGQRRCMLRTIQKNFDSLGQCSQHSCGQAGMRLSWTLLWAPCAAPDPSSVSLCRWLGGKQERREEEGFLFPDSVGCVQGMWFVSVPSSLACFSHQWNGMC